MPHMKLENSKPLIGGNVTHFQGMGSGIGQPMKAANASFMNPVVNNSFSMDGADDFTTEVAGSRMLQEY
jgi:hypothetical protein